MQTLVFAVVLIGFFLLLGAFSISFQLTRIADAIEAQNRAYGIGVDQLEPQKGPVE